MKIIASFCCSLLILAGTLAARAETFRTDINPALLYYQAFLMKPTLTDTDLDYLFTNSWRQPLPARVVQLTGYYTNSSLRLWRQAARQIVPCDWGIDLSRGAETLLPELTYCKSAAKVLRLHAMRELQQGDDADAAADLLAALAVGRNSSRDGTRIAVLVQLAIENLVCGAVAENFGHFSPHALQQLAAGFDTAPERRTLRDCLPAEQFTSGRWLDSQIEELQAAHPDDEAAVMGGLQKRVERVQFESDLNYWRELTNAAGGTVAGLQKMNRLSESFSDQLAPILALPHGEFEVRFEHFAENVKRSGDFMFANMLAPWSGNRQREFTVEVNLAMVRAAIAFQLHGNAGLKSVMDPCGQGPFTCERFAFQGQDRGFRLTSAYAPAATPVTMIFVQTDGPLFNVAGNHAGEAVAP